MGGGYMNDFYAREFWRFVVVQKTVGKLAMTAVDYPPMQDPASFNLEAMKKKIEAMIKQHEGESVRSAQRAERPGVVFSLRGRRDLHFGEGAENGDCSSVPATRPPPFPCSALQFQ